MADERNNTTGTEPASPAANKEKTAGSQQPALVIDASRIDPELDPNSPQFVFEKWQAATGITDRGEATRAAWEVFAQEHGEDLQRMAAQIDASEIAEQIAAAGPRVAEQMQQATAKALEGLTPATIAESMATFMEHIAQKTMDTAALFDSFIKSEQWKSIQSAMAYIAENAGKIAESLDEIDRLQPYLQKELEKPQYNGKTISELMATPAAEDAGKTAAELIAEEEENGEQETLWQQALQAARAAYNREQQAPRITTTRAEIVEYPLDKVNGTIWKLLEHDTAGQIAIAMESAADRRKGRAIDLMYSIDFDELGEDLKITKRLTPFDKRVYMAVSALFNAGNDAVTMTQIYYAMGYTGTPGKTDRERINSSVTKMESAKIYVNNENEAEAYNYTRYVYDGRLLPIERCTAINNGQFTEAAIRIFREPPLISFAKERQQISTISVKMLQSPVSKTEANLLIEDYLIERLARAKRGKSQNRKHRILYKTLYEQAGINGTSAADKKNRQRLPAKIEKYLQYYVKCGYILRYTMEADGITAYF